MGTKIVQNNRSYIIIWFSHKNIKTLHNLHSEIAEKHSVHLLEVEYTFLNTTECWYAMKIKIRYWSCTLIWSTGQRCNYILDLSNTALTINTQNQGYLFQKYIYVYKYICIMFCFLNTPNQTLCATKGFFSAVELQVSQFSVTL